MLQDASQDAAQLDGNNFQICQEKENRAESIKILVRED